jgi:hypothetical protein
MGIHGNLAGRGEIDLIHFEILGLLLPIILHP